MKTILTLIFLAVITNPGISQWLWAHPFPTGNTLVDVQLGPSNVGWAVGNSGTILKSTDGGINWVNKSCGVENDLTGIFIFDEYNTIIVGYGIIIRTSDGGENWSIQSSSASFEDVSFCDSQTGIAVGDGIYKTTDGGMNWVWQNSYYMQCVTFQGSNVAYAAGYWGKIVKTTDSGANWIELDSGTSTILHGISFVNDSIGYISGEDGIILKTTNGGVIWHQLPSGVSNHLWDISFSDESTGMAVSNIDLILRTTDGGQTWNIKYSYNGFISIASTSDNNAIAVGSNGFILSTDDGGNNWMQRTTRITTLPLESVFFLNENFGAVVGLTTFLCTTDGGSEWFAPSVVNSWLYDVFFTNENNGIAVGWLGEIYRTTDGQNWLLQSRVTSNNLRSVYFPDFNNGVIVGDLGTILKSTDGGEIWNLQLSGTNQNLNGVYFTDINNGTAVGDSGTIIRTTDGGINWFNQPIGILSKLTSLYFTETNYGIIVGENGTILKTNDGGQNWLLQNSGTVFFLKDLSMINESTGVIVGYDHEDLNTWPNPSMILRTTNGGADWTEQISGKINKPLSGVYFTDINHGIAVGRVGTILKTTNAGMTFLNEEQNGDTPTRFNLSQNYPNPFNPITKIKYSVTVPTFVTIKVFDILGNEIETLVNEEKVSGNYVANFDASRLASGVYFYRIKAGDFIATKKMILLK